MTGPIDFASLLYNCTSVAAEMAAMRGEIRTGQIASAARPTLRIYGRARWGAFGSVASTLSCGISHPLASGHHGIGRAARVAFRGALSNAQSKNVCRSKTSRHNPSAARLVARGSGGAVGCRTGRRLAASGGRAGAGLARDPRRELAASGRAGRGGAAAFERGAGLVGGGRGSRGGGAL